MKVIHIRNAPTGWETNKQYQYIGRAGKNQAGTFGNPHAVKQPCGMCKGKTHQRDETIKLFEEYYLKRFEWDENWKFLTEELKKKEFLVCFCSPQPCHGDIYLKYLEN